MRLKLCLYSENIDGQRENRFHFSSMSKLRIFKPYEILNEFFSKKKYRRKFWIKNIQAEIDKYTPCRKNYNDRDIEFLNIA